MRYGARNERGVSCPRSKRGGRAKGEPVIDRNRSHTRRQRRESEAVPGNLHRGSTREPAFPPPPPRRIHATPPEHPFPRFAGPGVSHRGLPRSKRVMRAVGGYPAREIPVALVGGCSHRKRGTVHPVDRHEEQAMIKEAPVPEIERMKPGIDGSTCSCELPDSLNGFRP